MGGHKRIGKPLHNVHIVKSLPRLATTSVNKNNDAVLNNTSVIIATVAIAIRKDINFEPNTTNSPGQ